MALSIVKNSPEIPVVKEDTKQTTTSQMSFRANSDNSLERVPQEDSFVTTTEKKNNGLKTALGVAGTAALALGIICYSKGKGADDVEKSFGKRMKDGWDELWGITKKNADKAKDSSDDAAKAAEKAKKEAEEKAKKEAEEKAKLDAEEKAKKEAEEKAKLEAEYKAHKEKAILKDEKRAEKALKDKEYTDFWNRELTLKELKENGDKDLNFELVVDDNKIIVKNGEILECINKHNQKWQIDDNTDPQFVERINAEVNAKLDEIVNERQINEAIKLNEEFTKKMDIPTKSAKESAAILQHADEIQELQDYCAETYGKAMKDDMNYLYEKITDKFPKSKIKKVENLFVATVKDKKTGKTTKYFADEKGVITRIYHIDTKAKTNFVVNIENNFLTATSADEKVVLDTFWAKNEEGYAIFRNDHYWIKLNEIENYGYEPLTEKAKSKMKVATWSGNSDRVKQTICLENGELIDSFKGNLSDADKRYTRIKK